MSTSIHLIITVVYDADENGGTLSADDITAQCDNLRACATHLADQGLLSTDEGPVTVAEWSAVAIIVP